MSKTFAQLAAGLGLLLVLCANVLAAASLSITPLSVSNSYSGTISFTISGITNGETVYLDRFLDLNTNKAVSVSEPLTARWELTDSVAPSVGGVINTAIPADQDLDKKGQIIVRLPFQTLDQANWIAGAHRFRLSSPTPGRFPSPIEASLTVTQTASSLVVTGTVFTVNKPETNPIVTLLNLENEFVSATVADAKGNYRLSVAPGEYRLVACAPSHPSIGKFIRLSVFNVSNLAPPTQKIHLTNSPATQVISGLLRNGTTGKSLPGLMVFLFSTNDQATFAFSDASGAFSVPVTPGQWTLVPSQLRLGQLGCNASQAPIVLNVSGGDLATNIDFTAASSLVFGYLVGTNGHPLSGICMLGTNGLTAASVMTDTNGYFSTGVTDSSQWSWQPDPAALSRLGYLSPTSGLFGIPTNANFAINEVATPITSRIQGSVRLDDGTPVGDLPVITYSDDSTPHLSSVSITKPDGTFDTGACAGIWAVSADNLALRARSLLQPGATFYSLSDGIYTNVDLVLRRITGKLTVRLRDTKAKGVASAPIICEAILGDSLVAIDGSTDESGTCVFDLCDGTWSVEIDLDTLGFASPAPQKLVVSNSTTATLDFRAEPPQPLAITTTVVPPALVGIPYEFQLQAQGSDWRFYWNIIAGSLPRGLSLDSEGLISGTATGSTNTSFTVTVNDDVSHILAIDLTFVAAYPVLLRGNFDPVKHVMQVHLTGEANRRYVLESASTVDGPWHAILTNLVNAPESVFTTIPATNSTTFYRMRMDF